MTSVADWLSKYPVGWIECLTIDHAGLGRGKLIAIDKFSTTSPPRIPLDIFFMSVDGQFNRFTSKDKQFFNSEDADCALVADASTLCTLPWLPQPTASVICDAYTLEGEVIDFAPRQLLKRILKNFAGQGWSPIVAVELEFCIFKPLAEGEYIPQTVSGTHHSNAYAMQPYGVERQDGLDAVFAEVLDACTVQNLSTDSLIQEVGEGQYEINLIHSDPLRQADDAYRFKRTVREVVKKHGLHASFMAKPLMESAGNSMHIHHSLQDSETKQNLFSNADGSNSDLFLSSIAGLQRYLPDAMALLLPYVNSYRRMIPDQCAPLNVEWGHDNRTVGLRIPRTTDGKHHDPARRIEIRHPGADCNPYLALAAVLATSYEGMVSQLMPSQEFTGSAYDLPPSISLSLRHALDALQASDVMIRLLGKEFVRFYSGIKEQELSHFERIITPWETQNLSGII